MNRVRATVERNAENGRISDTASADPIGGLDQPKASAGGRNAAGGRDPGGARADDHDIKIHGRRRRSNRRRRHGCGGGGEKRTAAQTVHGWRMVIPAPCAPDIASITARSQMPWL